MLFVISRLNFEHQAELCMGMKFHSRASVPLLQKKDKFFSKYSESSDTRQVALLGVTDNPWVDPKSIWTFPKILASLNPKSWGQKFWAFIQPI